MKRRVLLTAGFFLKFYIMSFSQQMDISIYYGRFYPLYKYIDYGTGFGNVARYQYNPYPTVALNKTYSKRLSAEIRASFLAYNQYTGTRLYSPGFESNYLGANISVTGNYSFLVNEKINARVKAGLGVGILFEQYLAEFTEIFIEENGSVDSISRGFIKRDFRSFFPTVVSGVDVSYKVAKRFAVSLAFTYQKGFSKITEYDFYYNDGSGNNDQQAKQWGTGDFYGFQLGLRYLIRDEKGEKFKKDK